VKQVKVETDVNVTSRGDDNYVTRDVMEACASRLNASLQQVALLDQVITSSVRGTTSGRPLTVIQATSDCPEATMTSAGFLYLNSGWHCPAHLVLDHQLWICVSRTYIILQSLPHFCEYQTHR